MKKATKKVPAKPELPPTIGEYINDRLNSMAYGGHFGGAGSIPVASAAMGLVEEYVEKYRIIRY